MNTIITIEAEVLTYERGVLRQDYDGGSSTSYDGTELRIDMPTEHAGETLLLLHDRPTDPASLWRRIGARLRFKLSDEWLAPGVLAFAAAAEQVQLIDDSG